MSVMNLNQNNFDSVIKNAEGPVLVDFWAAWCGPCAMMAPTVEEVAKDHPELTVGKVNVDEAMELAARYGISAIPTLIYFKNGNPVSTMVGVQSREELENHLR